MRHLRFLHIIFYIMYATSYSVAQDSARIERATLKEISWQKDWENPASYGDTYKYNLSELTLTGNFKSSTSPFILENGKGNKDIEAKVISYLHLNKHITVWGNASYVAGHRLNVSWNSTADYNLLAPYILADSVGGDTERERYNFLGGYARRSGNWRIGTELQFRAEQEWRRQDPRMRGIVSDLSIKLGASYLLNNYSIGVVTLVNIYKQSTGVDFYNELGGVPEYIMTGLGTYYKRFSGTNTNISYKGKGVAFLFSVTPILEKGFFSKISYSKQSYNEISDEYNSLPLTTLNNNKAVIIIGYNFKKARNMFSIYGYYKDLQKHGIEHIAGDAKLGDYPIIANLTMYKHYIRTVYLGAKYIVRTQSEWTFGGKVGFVDNNSKYIYPYREIGVSHFFSELSINYIYSFAKQWLLDCGVTTIYFRKSNNKIDMPYTDIEKSFVKYINYNYAQLKSNTAELKANMRIDYKLKKSRYGVFADIYGGIISNSEHVKGVTTSLTLGLLF